MDNVFCLPSWEGSLYAFFYTFSLTFQKLNVWKKHNWWKKKGRDLLYFCQAINMFQSTKNIYFYEDFCFYLFTLFTFKKAGGEGQILFLKNSLTGSYIQYKNLQNPFFPVVLFKQRSVMLSFYESICYTVQNNLLFYI